MAKVTENDFKKLKDLILIISVIGWFLRGENLKP